MRTAFSSFIDGGWVAGVRTWSVSNPYDGSIVAEVSGAGPNVVDAAIGATVRGARMMRSYPLHKRQQVLRRASDMLTNRLDELAGTLAREAGKPVRHARAEVSRAAVTFALAAGETASLKGDVMPLDVSANGERRIGLTRRMPVGAIAGITPFNFPLNLVAHKVAPALASGNAIVVKPASATPLSALLLAEILHEAGAPAGACNVIPCRPVEATALVTDERIAMVSFTGSADVGWGIKRSCGKKRVCLELGGNAAVIVMADADLEKAIPRIVLGGYAYAGQVCISVQRIYVHERIRAKFLDAYLPCVQALRTGDPLDQATDMGPVIDDAAADRIEQGICEAVRAGGKLLLGGERQGRLIQPTVLADVPESCSVVCDEAFAPLTVVQRFSDTAEALGAVNRSRFGLQAGVFTSSLNTAFRAFDELEVGGVIVNDSPMFRVDSMPYGGVKDSGFGREGIASAMLEMTEPRLMVVELDERMD